MKHSAFESSFERHYNDIMDRFMRDTTELDSHKQAAIITISSLEAKIIEHEVESDIISIVPQLIAVNVGLSYMNDRLNEILEKGTSIQLTSMTCRLPLPASPLM